MPGVELPGAGAQVPKAGEKFIWFWFWPAQSLRDHRSGIVRRHHVLDVTFQKAIREAERTGLTSACHPHVAAQFRDAPAGSAVGIRDVQDLRVMRTYPQRNYCTRPGIPASACAVV